LACYAHDILLAVEAPRGLSARNCFRSRVTSIEPAGGQMLVTLQSLAGLRALVTAEAVADMGLAAQSEVTVIIKAMSLVVMA
jgi:molybdopterin-binding protein